jgi:AcrR family transcriptional regulator
MTETREHILMTAIKLLNEQGFASVSMNDIVRESGLSKGGVYWHFKSKGEILEAVYDYFLEAQLQFVTAALAEQGSVSERLRRVFQLGGIELDSKMPPPLELYSLALREETLMKRMMAFYEAYRQRIAALIQQGIDQGEFALCDAESVAVSVVSFMEGIVIVGSTVLAQSDFQTQLNTAIDLMLNGLLTRSTS